MPAPSLALNEPMIQKAAPFSSGKVLVLLFLSIGLNCTLLWSQGRVWQLQSAVEPTNMLGLRPPSALAANGGRFAVHYSPPASTYQAAWPQQVMQPVRFSQPRFGTRTMAGTDAHAKLIFCRHGQSEWNVANIFTGWVDVDLSEKGLGEAKNAGTLMKASDIKVDIAFTSVLKRAMKTLNIALEASDQLHVPVTKTWRLNERMYGGLTGQDKKKAVAEFGADQVQIWRRSFDVPPPPLDADSEYHPSKDPKYADLKPEEIPSTECLKDTIARVMPFWEENIAPELKAGKTVLIAAHGNSIRAVLKYIEGISEDSITGLEVPTGTPLVYELDSDLKPIATDGAMEPLKFGRYLGDAEAVAAAAAAVKAQTR